ncbi:MAG TPA: DUF433 domain-containing protein [Chitinophagaceae bacterium]
MKTIIYKNIVADEEICGGRPTIDGTRITVKTILGYIVAGDKDENILEGYPRLTKEDIATIKEYATLQFDPQFFAKAF